MFSNLLKRLISIKRFKQAIRLVDPLISKSELHRYVNWVFEPKKVIIMNHREERAAKLNEKQTLMRDFEEIIQRLENCSCFMH